MNFKKLFHSYKHIIPLVIYAIFYITTFMYLEKTITLDTDIINVHMKIDDCIPFIEFFVVPYYLWFAYVFAVIGLLFFTNKKEYYKCCIFLFVGMTIFLIVSALFPNGHHLRPDVMPRDNIFTALIAKLYATDTSTNIVPSIHVYNSIGAHLGLLYCTNIKIPKWLKISSFILCISIILSTVFIKQHSIFDMLTAFALFVPMYYIIYKKQLLDNFVTKLSNL